MLLELKKRGRKAETARLDLEPVKILWKQGKVSGEENLLKRRERQISLAPDEPAVLKTEGKETASLLLDFGCEIHGGIRIYAWQESTGRGIKVRIRFGESASEAMSELGGSTNATNDHARRDLVTEIGMMSMNAIGETGFRFVRIDLLEEGTLVLKSVLAELIYKDVPYRGRFQCSDELVNRIWETGAYTMHLNMQEFIWDGIKRDRLVWVADIHSEMLTIRAVFGEDPSVKKSLDFIRKISPLPGWINHIATYTMWYVITLYDWFFYTGDLEWIREQEGFLKGIAEQLKSCIGADGKYLLDKELRFVDWPSSEDEEIVDAGMKAIHFMAVDRLGRLFTILDNKEMQEFCREEMNRLKNFSFNCKDAKASAALAVLAGLMDAEKTNENILKTGGAKKISSYMGYYILAARAKAGDISGALESMKDYWGGMLSLGATTFWEDFDVEWMNGAAPIDRLPREGETDIHGTKGSYCYKGFRHSLCHGWASGPVSWLSRYILGVEILESGCRKLKIRPELGTLEWAEGVFPTPLGDVSVKVWKKDDGETAWEVNAPKEIEIING